MTLPYRSFVAVVLAATLACSPDAQPAPPSAPADVTRHADAYWAALIEEFPLTALFSGAPGGDDDRLGDNSIAALRRWEAREDAWLADLHGVDTAALAGRPEFATYGVLRETLESSVQERVCRRELWRASQLGGVQSLLPQVGRLQPLGSAELRAAALTRWREMPGYVDTEIANLRAGLAAGYTVPRGNVEKVLVQLDDLLAQPPAESPFAALGARDSAPGFREDVVRIVESEIVPAVRRYRAFLADDYLPRARTTTDLAAIPGGAECYRALVRSATTLDVEPKALYDTGQAEMARIDSAMREIAVRSFGTSDVPALLARMRRDPAFKFRTREEMIETATAAAARAKAAMPRWFGRLPKADFIVDPCLPYEEESGCPGSYVAPAADGSRPGRYRLNAGNPPGEPRAWAEGVAFHEGIPGHHLEIALAMEREGAHPIQRFSGFSGYSEGWALYAEKLALEMDLYSSDLMRFGEWGEQGLRAARLVVDPGLHVFGWTRERAIDYMLRHLTLSRRTVESEVDRYIVNPGQATSYMTGRLEIERLRHEAERRLGERFDIREFHDQVLSSGSIPLGQLRRQVGEWLAAVSARAGP